MLDVSDDCTCPHCEEIRLLRDQLKVAVEWGEMWKRLALEKCEAPTT